MTTADRISDIYKGKIWSEQAQRVARDRIDWLAAQARGTVLDFGCSQGITAVLCARGGHETLGVDISADHIAYAESDHCAEPADVRGRLRFRVADASALDGAERFDTVLLGNVIEAHRDPAAIVAAAVRLLLPGGTLALTTTFGYRPRRDHAFYAGSLLEVLAPHCTPDSVDVVDGHFRVRASQGPMPDAVRAGLLAGLQPTVEERFLEAERALREAEAAWRRAEVRATRFDEVADRLRATDRELRQAERQRDDLAYRARTAEWRYRTLRNRRWVRLGGVLAKLRRHPTRLAALPRDLAAAARRVPRLDPPSAPPSADLSSSAPDPSGHFCTIEVPAVVPPDGPVARPELTAAVILDTFTAAALRYEWHQIEPGPGDWRDMFERDRPDLLFVESAWWGNGGRWHHKLAPNPVVREMIGWCRERGIPTVFWNKEDPPNFDRFIETAAHFDHVFTVDENCVPRYRERLGHDRVGVLQFAAQPRIHNPIAVPGGRRHDVAFAGTYYARRHPDRFEQVEAILAPAREFGIHIYSRVNDDPEFAFPAEYEPHIVGSVPYERMLAAYKSYKVFLNVNSVTESPTMCARRVFELAACGTPVVSGYARAIESTFGGLVAVSETADDTDAHLRELLGDQRLRDRRAHLAMREVLRHHTFSHRVDAMLRATGRETSRTAPAVSVLLPTNRSGQVADAIEQVARQRYRPLELVLVLHGLDIAAETLRAKCRAAGIDDVVVLAADRSRTLGACLNLAVEAASGDLLAKMDDDNRYGEHYLGDLVDAFDYTDAGIVGKWAHYVHLTGTDATALRFPGSEHTYTSLVQGGTILSRRQVVRDLRFADLPRAVDTDLLRRARAAGVRIYSADRFNFVSVRSADATTHTWQVSDEELLRDAVVEPGGIRDDQLMF